MVAPCPVFGPFFYHVIVTKIGKFLRKNLYIFSSFFWVIFVIINKKQNNTFYATIFHKSEIDELDEK